MTNIIRQLLMLTYDVHALLEAVCCNGYLGYIWIRGESKIDEDHVDGAIGSMEKGEMHKLGHPRIKYSMCGIGIPPLAAVAASSLAMWTMKYKFWEPLLG